MYDNFAKEFDHTRYSIWKSVKTFLDNLPKYSIIADVGCGNGKNIRYRSDLIFFGNDICEELIEIAKTKDKTNRNSYIICNGDRLPYKSNTYDAVICIAVLHHVKNRKRFFDELLRILKPGGKLLVSVWAYEQEKKAKWIHLSGTDYMIPWRENHKRFYHLFTKKEMEDLVDNLDATIFYEQDNWFCKVTKALL